MNLTETSDTQETNVGKTFDTDEIQKALTQLAAIQDDLRIIAAAERSKERGKRWGVRLVNFLETHWSVRLSVFVLTACVLAFGVVGVVIYWEERQARHEERLARAWQNLATPAVGNSGKGLALSHLAQSEIGLDHLDLSCKAMGGYDVDPNAFPQDQRLDYDEERCVRPPVLSGVDMRSRSRISFDRVNLTDTEISNAHFEGVDFNRSDLTATRVSKTRLQDARACVMFWGYSDLLDMDITDLTSTCSSGWGTNIEWPSTSFQRVTILDSDLGGACFSGAQLQNVEINGSDLSESTFLQTHFHGAVSFRSSNLSHTRWMTWRQIFDWSASPNLDENQMRGLFEDLAIDPPKVGTTGLTWTSGNAERYHIRLDRFRGLNFGCGPDISYNMPLDDLKRILAKIRLAFADKVAENDASLKDRDRRYQFPTLGAKRFSEIDFSDTFITFTTQSPQERQQAQEAYGNALKTAQAAIRENDYAKMPDVSEINALLRSSDTFRYPASYGIGFGDPEGLRAKDAGVMQPISYFPEIIPGLPASAGPEWVCFASKDTVLLGITRRPPADHCIANPWYHQAPTQNPD